METKTRKIIGIIVFMILVIILVIGLILTRCIGCKDRDGAIELTDQELTSGTSKAFGSQDAKLAIYPQSGELNIKQNVQNAIGLGIRNLLENVSGTQKFSYEVVVDESTCGGEKNDDLLNWIILGRNEANIPIDVGSFYSTKIYFKIPKGAPECTVKYMIEVKTDNGQIGKSYNYSHIPFIISSRR
jgi:hypothetical protein